MSIMTCVLMKRGHLDTGPGRKPCEDRGSVGGRVSASQGHQRRHRGPGSGGRGESGTGPGLLTPRSGTLVSWRMRGWECVFKVSGQPWLTDALTPAWDSHHQWVFITGHDSVAGVVPGALEGPSGHRGPPPRGGRDRLCQPAVGQCPPPPRVCVWGPGWAVWCGEGGTPGRLSPARVPTSGVLDLRVHGPPHRQLPRWLHQPHGHLHTRGLHHHILASIWWLWDGITQRRRF